jgi:eukaryotic-like serine/threonine-protein kinase
VKICDSCRTSYPGEFTICPKDKTPLHAIGELTAGIVLRGKYELISKLGAGGMGAVYKARHLAFGEMRALKIIGSHLLADEGFVGRFKSEAVVTRKLQHPNVVRVEDLDTTEDGQPFIVMEYVEGESLRALIHRTGALAPARALDLAAQTCLALAAAHGLGVLHRDIKPDNILIVTQPDGREVAKVLDFGLAKVLSGFKGATQQMATSTGMMMGTPHYMAPEQAMAQKGGSDGRMDLYALGVVLYEMLTGNVPFDSDTPMGIVYQHIQAAPVPPDQAFPDLAIPPAVSAVVLKAMEKDPAHRFANAEEMHAALTGLAASLPAGAGTPAPRSGSPGAKPPTAARIPGAPNSGAMPTVPPRVVPVAGAPTQRPAATAAPRARPGAVPGSATRVQGGAGTIVEADEDESGSSWGVFAWIAAAVIVGGVCLYWFRSKPAAPAASTGAVEATASAPAPLPAAVEAVPAGASANGDDTIRAEVQHVLFASSPLRGARIDISVTNGIVSLTGTVPNTTAKDLATSLASSVPGVRRVFATFEIPDVPAAATAPPVVTDSPTPPPPPPSAPTSAGDKVRQLMEEARREVERGNHEGAARIFDEVLSIDPSNAQAREGSERSRDASRRPPPPGGGGPRR